MTQNIRQLANRKGFTWWCPGCRCTHAISVGADHGPNWTWNGSWTAPTFERSVLASHIKQDLTDEQLEQYDLDCEKLEHNELLAHPVYGERCHTFVRDGQIQFLGDCTHELKNTTVPIPPWPHAPGTYGGILEPDQP